MFNVFVLVGKLNKLPITENIRDSSCHYLPIELEITQNFRNSNGIYETYVISVDVTRGDAELIKKYCEIGDILGIKGRINFSKDSNAAFSLISEKTIFIDLKKRRA